MTQSNFDKGLELRRRMFGPEGAEIQVDNATSFMAPMQDIVTRICFGELWQRGGIDLKTRSLLTLAMLVASGRQHEIKIHTRGAIANGATRQEIQELVLHAYFYCGVALSVDAMRAVEPILDELLPERDESVPQRKVEPGTDRIGFVGLGNMGAPMSACIARAGFNLSVYDIDQDLTARHADKIGARAAASLSELARNSDVIVTMLPTGAVVRKAVLESGFADALAPGSLVIDMSSSEPVGSQEIAAELKKKNVGFVDAPVSGAVPRATTGTLAIMIGSDDAALTERARRVLAAMGDRLFETGGVGTGHAMKALNNYVAGAGFAAGAEALIAAEKFGLDTKTALDIMNVSTGRNFSTEATLKTEVLTGRFASGFGLGLLAKDVKIAAGLAEAVGARLPLLKRTRKWWDKALEKIGPEKDHTLAYSAWRGDDIDRPAVAHAASDARAAGDPARCGLVIGGKVRLTENYRDVKNPATGETVGEMPVATPADLDDAVAAATQAFGRWSTTSEEERKAACNAIADKIEAHAEELAQLITREQGKPLNGLGSRFEAGGAVAWARHTAGLELPVEVIQDNNEGRVELHRRPLGVVGSITPWNWPMLIAVWHILPAVRTGNTVVIKPSPYTPLSTIRLVELMNEVLPAGVVNVVSGPDSIGAAMSSHPGIAKMVFTGSIDTGKKVMASSAETLKRLTLELGGNDAGIVLPDADPKQIAEGLFWGAFINGGQTCGALKRLYVHDSIHDEVCEELAAFAARMPMGDGLDENNLLGPIQNEMQYKRVIELVEDAKARGARVLTGGKPVNGKGYFYPITLVADVDHGIRLVDEEQFGPVLPIIRYRDVDAIVDKANDNPHGLGGSVWSRDADKAKALALRLECGSAWVNKHGAIQPDAPFGGIKSSGIGVEFGEEGLKEYTSLRTVYC